MTKLNWDRVRSESYKAALPAESTYNPLRYSYEHSTRRQIEYALLLLKSQNLLRKEHFANLHKMTVNQCSSFISQLKERAKSARALPEDYSGACPNERVLPSTVLPPNRRSNAEWAENGHPDNRVLPAKAGTLLERKRKPE